MLPTRICALLAVIVTPVAAPNVAVAQAGKDGHSIGQLTVSAAPVSLPGSRSAMDRWQAIHVGNAFALSERNGTIVGAAVPAVPAVPTSVDRPPTGGGAEERGFRVGLPLERVQLTSRFGARWHPVTGGRRFHSGVDIRAAAGTPVMAASNGTVTFADYAGGYGIMVEVTHTAGIDTRYAHLSAIAVSAGDRVARGQIIGYSGATGRVTGPHLHFEVRQDGAPVDPVVYLGW